MSFRQKSNIPVQTHPVRVSHPPQSWAGQMVSLDTPVSIALSQTLIWSLWYHELLVYPHHATECPAYIGDSLKAEFSDYINAKTLES